MPREKLDEKALRRDPNIQGRAVVLADGQEWILARPRMVFEASDSPVGYRISMTLDIDDDFEDLCQRRRDLFHEDGSEGAADVVKVVEVEMEIGRRLLLHNYDVPPDQIGRLLRLGYNPDESPEAWEIRKAIVDLAEGINAPKPSAAGEDSVASLMEGLPGEMVST